MSDNVVGFRNQETRVLRETLERLDKGEKVSALLIREDEGGDLILAFWGDMSKIEMLGVLASAQQTIYDVFD